MVQFHVLTRSVVRSQVTAERTESFNWPCSFVPHPRLLREADFVHWADILFWNGLPICWNGHLYYNKSCLCNYFNFHSILLPISLFCAKAELFVDMLPLNSQLFLSLCFHSWQKCLVYILANSWFTDYVVNDHLKSYQSYCVIDTITLIISANFHHVHWKFKNPVTTLFLCRPFRFEFVLKHLVENW